MDADSILKAVHRTYQGDTDYPSSGDSDYDLRFDMVEDGVNAWAFEQSEENVRWRELFVSLADAATGDKTASVGTSTYDCPDDFIDLTSWVLIGSTIYTVISPNDVAEKTQNDPNGLWCYITGNDKVGFTLHINGVVAGTINYDYYKKPSIPSTGTDKIEMRKPYFVVHYILARLYELDSRNDLVVFHEGKQKNLMDSMLIDNELLPYDNPSGLGDLQNKGYGVAFGK